MGLEQSQPSNISTQVTERENAVITPIAYFKRRWHDYIDFPYLQIPAANLALRVQHALTLPMEHVYKLAQSYCQDGATLTVGKLESIYAAAENPHIEEGRDILREVRRMFDAGSTMPKMPKAQRIAVVERANRFSQAIYMEYLNGIEPPQREIELHDSRPKIGLVKAMANKMDLIGLWAHDTNTMLTRVSIPAQMLKRAFIAAAEKRISQEKELTEEQNLTRELISWAVRGQQQCQVIREYSLGVSLQTISTQDFFAIVRKQFSQEEGNGEFLLAGWDVRWHLSSDTRAGTVDVNINRLEGLLFNAMHNAVKSQRSLENERSQAQEHTSSQHYGNLTAPTFDGTTHDSSSKVLDVFCAIERDELGRGFIKVIVRDRASGIRHPSTHQIILEPGFRVDFKRGQVFWVAEDGHGDGMHLNRNLFLYELYVDQGADLYLQTRSDGQRGAELVIKIPCKL